MYIYIVNKIYRKTYLQLKATGRKKMQTVFYPVTLLSVTLYSLGMTVWFFITCYAIDGVEMQEGQNNRF